MGKLIKGGSSGPAPEPLPPPPAPPPMLQSPQGAQAADDVKKRAAASFGAMGTIATSPAGLKNPAVTAQKTLLGG